MVAQPLHSFSGGGIGGLTFAVTLRKLCGERVRVNLYEAAHEFSEVGAGIGGWPRVRAIMEALGLTGDLSTVATGNDGTLNNIFSFHAI